MLDACPSCITWCVTTDSLMPERYRLSVQICSTYSTVQLVDRLQVPVNLDSKTHYSFSKMSFKRETITKSSWFKKKKLRSATRILETMHFIHGQAPGIRIILMEADYCMCVNV
jgi:hypothetical protein